MAFPWDKEEGFEDGTIGILQTETDTGARLNVRSYRDLARLGRRVAPWRGAYCMEVDLGVSTAEATANDPDVDISANGETFIDFMLYISPNIVMADDNEFVIFRLLATSTDEGSLLINYTDETGLRIGLSEPTATAGDAVYTSISTGVWHHICLGIVIDNSDSSGEIDLYLDGTLVLSLDDLDQGAITSASLGVIGQDAGTTKGFLLFDDFREDSAQFEPYKERFPQNLVLTKSAHAFVGPGLITLVQLISGAGTDCVLTVYDTDRAETHSDKIVERLANVSDNETLASASAFDVQRGCYVELAGTDPRALVRIANAPSYGSDGAALIRGSRVA